MSNLYALKLVWALGAALVLFAGCGGDNPSGDGGPPDDADTAADGEPDTGDTAVTCDDDDDCDDGLFCNGEESCDPEDDDANEQGCLPGDGDPCADTEECDEDEGACLDECDRNGDSDGDGHDSIECGGDDCDDDDDNRYPGNTEVCDTTGPDADTHDEDCDPATIGPDGDDDSYVNALCCNEQADASMLCGLDCDDDNAEVNPDAPEVCNEVDDNCNGEVNEGVWHTYYPDADGDGYGNPSGTPELACAPPDDFVENDDDCDDTEREINPAATEVCDGVDNNCDGITDIIDGTACPCVIGETTPCGEPDGAGGFVTAGECEEGIQRCVEGHWGECTGAVFPTTEVCNTLDDDCDGDIDDGVLISFYPDADGDDFGDSAATAVLACTAPADHVADNTDCDDTTASRNPGLAEVCDLIHDNDCDPTTNPFDSDGDHHDRESCGGDDCDDTTAARSPDNTEICGNHIDDDCNGEINDDDCDGHDAIAHGGDDCDDSNPDRYPGNPEVCGNAIDEDCDGDANDFDCDGHDSIAHGGDDCDDTDDTSYAGAAEPCNRIDNNCSTGGGADTSEDFDEDGFAPIGHECSGGLPTTDCDDTDDEIYPGATEICNGEDDDCDGSTDEEPAATDSCGTAPHATLTCSAGACGVDSCDGTWMHCDTDISNGCEEDVDVTYAHCGDCDASCSLDMAFCDGGVCHQDHGWSLRAGNVFTDDAEAVVVDSSDNIHVTGTFAFTADFGGGDLTSAGGADGYIASFSADGTHLASMRFGGTGDEEPQDIAVDSAGNVYVIGHFGGTTDLGDGPTTAVDTQDLFIASYTPAGAHRWSHTFGGFGWDWGHTIAVDSAGNVYVSGRVISTVDFGGGAITERGVFVASFTSAGVHRWSEGYGGSEEDGFGIATNGSLVCIAGRIWSDTIDFGGGVLTSAGPFEIIVACFDTDGVHVWSDNYGSGGGSWRQEQANGIVIDSAGNTYVTGLFGALVDFGGGAHVTAGSYDFFLASFDATGGHRWSQRFGAASHDEGVDIALDASNNLYVTGLFNDTVDFGGGDLTATGSGDIFAASYTSAGVFRWSEGFGSTNWDVGRGIDVDSSGNVYVVGEFQNTVDFGGAPLTAAGEWDAFIMQIVP